MRRRPLALLLLAATAVSADEPFETPPSLQASRVLAEPSRRGPHHEVAEAVPSDGLFNVYSVTTPWGAFEARGDHQLRVRIQEANALGELAEVNKAAVAAGALADSAVDLAKGAAHAVSNPKETAQGIGAGAKRLVGRLGRSARRAVEQGKEAVDEDDPDRAPEGPAKTREELARDAGTAVARSVFGVSRAFREWCARLGVDPYTDNEVLRREIENVARYDAGGRFALRLVPLGTLGVVAGHARSVDDLVWTKDPDELLTMNEKRLEAMGATPELSREFRLNARLGLSSQVRLVDALDRIVTAEKRVEVIRRAAAAPDREAARFFEVSALLLADLHARVAPVRRVLGDDGPIVAALGNGAAVFLLPGDYVSWTSEISRWEEESRGQVIRDAPGSRLEMWVTGDVSPRARAELAARGWTVRARAFEDEPATRG